MSVILYGSAAMDDWQEKTSDLNVLCVLDRISTEQLSASEPIFRWWKEQKNPVPLLLTAEEVKTATDCFPIEFHDMQEHRRVLFGSDVVRDLEIDRSFYRAQVEHELRAKQIRLRQKAAEVLRDSERCKALLIDSISTFCVLGRHALILSGTEPRWKKDEIVRALSARMKRELAGFDAIVAIRTSRGATQETSVESLLQSYLEDVDSLVRFVDELDR
jgi:hypothetical protein